MTKKLFLAGIATAFLLLPNAANASCEIKDAIFKPSGEASKFYEHEDCDTNTTKDLNGRTNQAAALAAALDSRIAVPGERLNLDLNWAANEFGTGGAVGGSAFFHVPELAPNLYLGAGGAYSTDGGGSLFSVGVSYAFSPF